MSADFWAGYFSGAVGIVLGNPLDILKVQLQARTTKWPSPQVEAKPNASLSFLRGTVLYLNEHIMGYEP